MTAVLPLIPAAIALVLALLLTPVVRDTSLALGWVDHPDRQRKLHRRAVPRTGGVAILLSYLASYGVALLPGQAVLMAPHLATIFHLLPGVAIVFAAGLADDRFDLKPLHKVAAEMAAAVWMYAAGVRIVFPGHAPCWGFLLTIGWLILCANAFNLIDGVDGLAAGVGFTASVAACVAGLLHGDATLALGAAPLAACLLGFLRYNFSPASIFLGDSGSLSTGFLLGAYTVIWSGKSAPVLGVAAPAMAVAVPLLEVGLSISRRFVANRPIFAGDRGHIHHRLLDRGFTPHRVALVLCAATAAGSVLSLIPNAAAVILAMAAGAAGVRYVGYAEFAAAARFVRKRLRAVVGAQVHVDVLERALRSAATVEECWIAIERAGRTLGYCRVEARLSGARFSSSRGEGREAWQMQVNLTGGDYVNVSQFRGAPEQPCVLAAFVDVLGEALPRALALVGEVEAGTLRRPRVEVAAGGRNGRMSESRLDEVDGSVAVERVAGMGVPHPVR